MSIDAKISGVIRHGSTGAGRLTLVDRPPASSGEPAGIAGVNGLSFESSPENIIRLSGLNIWGSADTIMLGDVSIAERVSVTRIRWRAADVIDHALKQLFGGKVILTALVEEEKRVSAQSREMDFPSLPFTITSLMAGPPSNFDRAIAAIDAAKLAATEELTELDRQETAGE